MRLMDSLRKAEEQGRETARRTLEKAREGWEDAERRIRRKMRIHPAAVKTKASAVAIPPSVPARVRDASNQTDLHPIAPKRGVPEAPLAEPVNEPEEDVA